MCKSLFTRTELTETLKSFKEGCTPFKVIKTINLSKRVTPEAVPDSEIIYVLDSSFNPPTKAHFAMALYAMNDWQRTQGLAAPARLLLLLATENADKPSKPASFEDRLIMMNMLALELAQQLDRRCPDHEMPKPQAIDIGVVKFPLFIDKANAIAASGVYSLLKTQVFLMGFDTLVRVLDPKYYKDKTLKSLQAFFAANMIILALRDSEDGPPVSEQRQFVERIAAGSLDAIHGYDWWSKRIEVVEKIMDFGDETVSSTRVRAAAKKRELDALAQLTPTDIANYVINQALYLE